MPARRIVVYSPIEANMLGFDWNIAEVGGSVGEFWQWAYSDVMSNANRGVLAEYLVAKALDVPLAKPRQEWASVDLTYGPHWIEVKASGYWQSWAQREPSTIEFGIAKTRFWDDNTGQYLKRDPQRWADLYVFCVHGRKERDWLDPLDVTQWRFLPVLTDRIDEKGQKHMRVRLKQVEEWASGCLRWHDLRRSVDRLLRGKVPRNADLPARP